MKNIITTIIAIVVSLTIGVFIGHYSASPQSQANNEPIKTLGIRISPKKGSDISNSLQLKKTLENIASVFPNTAITFIRNVNVDVVKSKDYSLIMDGFKYGGVYIVNNSINLEDPEATTTYIIKK
jgi:hypothetical protein